MYEDWQIVLDLPAENPKLGFDRYARALSEMIQFSKPQFATGIFGGWGSGKTTLMNTVEAELANGTRPIITVQFSAWRYEKEDHLIVPLLDSIRDAMVQWSENNEEADGTAAKDIARTIGSVTYAIVSGLSFKLGLPNAASISFDANKALMATKNKDKDAQEKVPRSFYYASFQALKKAFDKFSEDNDERRIVVFIDDLDRCLPTGALEVIESMKLFFDLPGFVFVVGLDRDIIEWCIDQNYHPDIDGDDKPDAAAVVRGADYLKKIFQVPFTLPTITFEQIEQEFLDQICSDHDLPQDQKTAIRSDVLPHLSYLVGRSGVNPREIKRYINAYTITRKTWPEDRPANADIILALQTVSFRPDWDLVARTLRGSTTSFLEALNDRRAGDLAALSNLDPTLSAVPESFFEYTAVGEPGAALIDHREDVPSHIEIGAPVLRAEADAAGVPQTLVEAQGRFRNLRPAARDLVDAEGALVDKESASSLHSSLEELLRDFESILQGPKRETVIDNMRPLTERVEMVLSSQGSISQKDWQAEVGLRFDTILRAFDEYFRSLRSARTSPTK